jgi:hypothetical protein
VAEAHPDGAAGLLKPEPFHQLERIVVAVPDVDAALGQRLGGLGGVSVARADREGGRALVEPIEVGDPDEADIRDRTEALEEPPRELVLPRPDRLLERRGECDPASFALLPEACEVVDRGDPPREALVVLRAGLEGVGERVSRRPNLIGAQRGKEVAAPVEDPEVRPEDLVRRAHHDVRADRSHVDPPVLREVHAVAHDDGIRALVDQRRELGGWGHGSNGVGRECERHDFRALGQRVLERVTVERDVVLVELDPAHRCARILGGQDPRADVRVVIQARDDDLVAGPKRPADGTGDREHQRGGVGPEHDLVGIGAEQVRSGTVRLVDDAVGLLAGGEGSVRVRVARPQVRGHGLDDRLRDL